jgi:hypothetical protein
VCLPDRLSDTFNYRFGYFLLTFCIIEILSIEQCRVFLRFHYRVAIPLKSEVPLGDIVRLQFRRAITTARRALHLVSH